MAEADIFDYIDLSRKAGAEKQRQARDFQELSVEAPPEANIDIFDQIAAERRKPTGKKELPPTGKEPLPSELNLMRRRLGMGETGTSGGEEGAVKKAMLTA